MGTNLTADHGFASAGAGHNGNTTVTLVNLTVQIINQVHLVGA
jgi:hypothetical protein